MVEAFSNFSLNYYILDLQKMIKEIAKKLLEVSIYLTFNKLQKFTNNYMNENYEDFIKRFKRPKK